MDVMPDVMPAEAGIQENCYSELCASLAELDNT
jgi:hypothetical protein